MKNITEFHAALDNLEKEMAEKRKQLIIQYCNEHARYKADDIVKDHIGSVKIVRIRPTYDSRQRVPEVTYVGVELKKDLTPKLKKGVEQLRQVWQNNIRIA